MLNSLESYQQLPQINTPTLKPVLSIRVPMVRVFLEPDPPKKSERPKLQEVPVLKPGRHIANVVPVSICGCIRIPWSS